MTPADETPVSADPSELHPETRAIRAGRADNDTALAPILWATTTFVTPTVDEGRRMATQVGAARFYSRYGNPTVAGFEDAIAQLEGAETARAFASGMGAISAVVLGLCSTGDHIVAQRQLYAGTQLLLQTACPRFGIDVTFVDATEPGAFAAAVIPGKTTLVRGSGGWARGGARSGWSRERPSWSTGSTPSPCSKAPTPRRSTP